MTSRQSRKAAAAAPAADEPVLLVSTVDAVERVRQQVFHQATASVAFDCEGNNMAQADGTLDLVSLALRPSGRVVLLDMTATAPGRDANCALLRDLMASKVIEKVVFDVRGDAEALRLHAGATEFHRMFDVQILACLLQRVKGSCTRRPGLAKLLAKEVPESAGDYHIIKQQIYADNTIWARRPLEPAALICASHDARFLSQLRSELVRQLFEKSQPAANEVVRIITAEQLKLTGATAELDSAVGPSFRLPKGQRLVCKTCTCGTCGELLPLLFFRKGSATCKSCVRMAQQQPSTPPQSDDDSHPRMRNSDDDEEDEDEDEVAAAPVAAAPVAAAPVQNRGPRVLLRGQTKAELNGLSGTVLRTDPSSGRLVVALEDASETILLLKPEYVLGATGTRVTIADGRGSGEVVSCADTRVLVEMRDGSRLWVPTADISLTMMP
jgi:hypothetical protein